MTAQAVVPELVHHKLLVNGSRLHLVGPGSGEPDMAETSKAP